ncbi:MAG TPA: ribonuclease III [Gammaproteobacteria bacterium]|nr:ribonuclease III [Gammaproteobacteria bacterium]
MSGAADKLKLGYRFTDGTLLEAALTHRSAGSINNERMEFLGDAILNFIIAEEIYQRFPRAHEGELSRLRASLVKEETLAHLARDLELGQHLILGQGEQKSGGHRRASTLADALEALIGAVYLDGGFAACREMIVSLYRERLDAASPSTDLKDPKTRLQEYLQSRRLPPPLYNVLEISGEAHAQTFRMECFVQGRESTQGTGSSRRRAEQDAAEKMLTLLEAR